MYLLFSVDEGQPMGIQLETSAAEGAYLVCSSTAVLVVMVVHGQASRACPGAWVDC